MRRHSAWGIDEPHERRRPRWHEFREAYPRIVALAALGALALLAFDGWLLWHRWRLVREIARLRGSMTALERDRTDALLAASENQLARQLEVVRRTALLDPARNLAVSVDGGLMSLQQEGAQLRVMRVRIGPEWTVGAGQGAVPLVPPRGKRTVVQVMDASFEWAVPDWVYAHRKLPVPVPAQPAARGLLGPIAVLLQGGTILYSQPEQGPLADANYVLPGSVRAEAADLQAIAANITPGMAVYFH